LFSLFGGTDTEKDLYFDNKYGIVSKKSIAWNTLEISDREKGASNFINETFGHGLIDHRSNDIIDNIFILTQKYNIKVIGVYFPNTNELNKLLENTDVRGVDSLFFTKPFHRILDYRHIFSDRQELFQDSSHLNRNGAEIFTQVIMNDINPIINNIENKTHLFLLSGQSNMVRLDPNVSFIPIIKNEFTNDKIIVIKEAENAQPILRWYKKWKPEGEGTAKASPELYSSLIKKARHALKIWPPTTSTFIWMQGESDAHPYYYKVYGKSLQGLVDQFRDDLFVKDMNVLIGRISNARCGTVEWDVIRQEQKEIAEQHSNWDWVNTDDIPRIQGDVHYNQEGYRLLGERFAEKAISLIRKNQFD